MILAGCTREMHLEQDAPENHADVDFAVARQCVGLQVVAEFRPRYVLVHCVDIEWRRRSYERKTMSKT